MNGAMQRQQWMKTLIETSGVCLSELMVAMAIGTCVVAGSLEAVNIMQTQAARQQRTMTAQQEMRVGLEVFEQEIRSASTIVSARPDRIEFLANVHALRTVTTGSIVAGQSVLPVYNGSGWDGGKTIVICGVSTCESHQLARPGQRTQLVLAGPVSRAYPAGASVEVRNRVAYYTRLDDDNRTQLMRQIDGGAGVLIGDLRSVRLSYWDEWGRAVSDLNRITRVTVELVLGAGEFRVFREVTVRT